MNDLLSLKFIGLYKNRKDWRDKTSFQIARKLRREAWYGKKILANSSILIKNKGTVFF